MNGFFTTVYGWLVSFAGAVAMFWGLSKGLGALRKWIKCKLNTHRQRIQMTGKILNQVSSIGQRIDNVERSVNDLSTQLRSDISRVSSSLQRNNEATATVMLQRMMLAYHQYVLGHKPIPLDVRTALVVMYDQYKINEMHNHVPADFREAIMACPLV